MKFGEDFTFVPYLLQNRRYKVVLTNYPDLEIFIDSIEEEPGEIWGYSLNMLEAIRNEKNEITRYDEWYPDFTEGSLEYYIAIV